MDNSSDVDQGIPSIPSGPGISSHNLERSTLIQRRASSAQEDTPTLHLSDEDNDEIPHIPASNLQSREDGRVSGADVPLPESATASSSSAVHLDSRETFKTNWKANYMKKIRRLKDYMPHLRKVLQPGRAHDHAEVHCFDYSGGSLVSEKTLTFESDVPASKQEFVSEIITNIQPETHCRVLVVEDLSHKMIRILGSCLSINPEFFEEHLLNCGWQDNEYSDNGSASWNATTSLIKNYASIRWHRLVQGRTAQPYEKQESIEFLDPSTTPNSWEEKLSRRRRVRHDTEPVTNIIRLPWDARLGSGGFLAWEERATVWLTHIDSCQIVIILLDPLPLIRHRKAFLDVQNQFSQQARRQRRSSISSTTDSHRNPDPEEGGKSQRDTPKSYFAVILARCSKIFGFRRSDRTWEHSAPDPDAHNELRPQRSATHSAQTSCSAHIAHSVHTSHAIQGDDTTQSHQASDEYCMFKDAGARLPQLMYSDFLNPHKWEQLACEDLNVQSTPDTLKRLVRLPHKSQGSSSGPLELLLMIIIRDTQKLLQSINNTLNKMDLAMLDDVLVQIQIDKWRKLLLRFETELRDLESCAPDFADFILGREEGDSTLRTTKQQIIKVSALTQGPSECQLLLGQLLKDIASAQRRTANSHRSLMTAMSLVESKRGISQAESVTKLTELAFFFIPLTFAASLFSMQVKEFDAGTTSVRLFLAVALTITICSYALRLVIRSSSFIDLLQRWKAKVREDRELGPSTQIATFVALHWTWQRIHTHIWPVYIVIPTIALLAGLWTRPLQGRVKSGVTTACAMLSFAVILTALLMRYQISPNWVKRNRRRFPAI
ncbi:MAG: hypothetical protein Q9209_002997 [Squamulea sp. 1 TL-2023]